MGERRLCTAEVRGSTPLRSTTVPTAQGPDGIVFTKVSGYFFDIVIVGSKGRKLRRLARCSEALIRYAPRALLRLRCRSLLLPELHSVAPSARLGNPSTARMRGRRIGGATWGGAAVVGAAGASQVTAKRPGA